MEGQLSLGMLPSLIPQSRVRCAFAFAGMGVTSRPWIDLSMKAVRACGGVVGSVMTLNGG